MVKCNVVNLIGCVTRQITPAQLKGVRYAPECLPDTVRIFHKSALAEFKNYLENWKLYGEDFVPKSDNSNSVFMEYFNYRKDFCERKALKPLALILPGARSVTGKIVMKDDMKSLMSFFEYMKTASENFNPKDYHEVVDHIASLMPQYAKSKYPQLRPEIIERSGDIFKWRTYLDVERKFEGKIINARFFDQGLKEKSLREFTEFVENLTGKKVLIGCPTRMNIAIDELGILNNPENYKDVDYILFGHGKGSSLITDTKNLDTWRFSDNDKSIWEFIETHVPKGKRVLVGACEKDGFTTQERRLIPQMYDKSNNFMLGIGNPVSTSFGKCNPAKICESGVRHIIGHATLEKHKGHISSFMEGFYGDAKIVYYDL